MTKVNITGASGAGSTTLGLALAQQLGLPYFDSDAFFWELTEVPFTIRRNPELRNAMIAEAIAPHKGWIIGGSVMSWDPIWVDAFDLVVFLYLKPTLRLERLKKREADRYGQIIFTDTTRSRQYQEFMEWAAGYDDNSGKGRGRTLQAHLTWLEKVSCPVLKIEGDMSVNERLTLITEALKQII